MILTNDKFYYFGSSSKSASHHHPPLFHRTSFIEGGGIRQTFA